MLLYLDCAGVGVLFFPFPGQGVGKEKEFWRILEVGFPTLIVTPNLDWAILFCWALERKDFFFASLLGLASLECFVYVSKKLSLLTKLKKKKLLNILVSLL